MPGVPGIFSNPTSGRKTTLPLPEGTVSPTWAPIISSQSSQAVQTTLAPGLNVTPLPNGTEKTAVGLTCSPGQIVTHEAKSLILCGNQRGLLIEEAQLGSATGRIPSVFRAMPDHVDARPKT